jgi:maleamate amidohydrolase
VAALARHDFPGHLAASARSIHMGERVWDRFLTEQDKEHLAATGRGTRRLGFGSKPALVIIDMYRAVFGDEPLPLLESIKEWPSSCGMMAWSSLPAFQELLAEARAADVPVIFITGMGDDAGMISWAKNRGRGGESTAIDPAAEDRYRRRFDIMDEIAPIAGETVLKKSAPSAFFGTPLASQLTALGVDTVIAVGESTSGCLRASVVDGCSYRYRMVVAEECAFDRHETTHALNLFDMNQKYADVLPLADVVEYLRSLATEEATPALEASEPILAR